MLNPSRRSRGPYRLPTVRRDNRSTLREKSSRRVAHDVVTDRRRLATIHGFGAGEVGQAPHGQKFTLSDGSVAYLSRLSEPELCANQSSDCYQRPHFAFDVVIEGAKLDHVEIYAFQTGSGMAVAPPRADAKAKAESLTTSEGDTARTPENQVGGRRPKSVGQVVTPPHGHHGPSRSGERADHPRNDKSLAAKSGRD